MIALNIARSLPQLHNSEQRLINLQTSTPLSEHEAARNKDCCIEKVSLEETNCHSEPSHSNASASAEQQSAENSEQSVDSSFRKHKAHLYTNVITWLQKKARSVYEQVSYSSSRTVYNLLQSKLYSLKKVIIHAAM